MPTPRIRLETPRLLLRLLTDADAPAVQRLAGDPEVAKNTADLPYPFELEAAEAWLAAQAELRDEGHLFAFAIEELAAPGVLIGAIGLTVNREHRRAELGYWLGRASWGKGFATEAGAAMLEYAFKDLELARVFANHLAKNGRSRMVLARLGFQAEGNFRRHVRRFGTVDDLAWWGLLREEWARASGSGA